MLQMLVFLFFLSFVVPLIEGAGEQPRLPKDVCLQTSHCQVQVVGPADQSGELNP